MKLPCDVYARIGAGGTGVQLYRVVGSSLGEMEEPVGYGRTLFDAIEDAKQRGMWPVERPNPAPAEGGFVSPSRPIPPPPPPKNAITDKP